MALFSEEASDFRHSTGGTSVADFLTDPPRLFPIPFNHGRFQRVARRFIATARGLLLATRKEEVPVHEPETVTGNA